MTLLSNLFEPPSKTTTIGRPTEHTELLTTTTNHPHPPPHRMMMMIRHDSEFSIDSNYDAPSSSSKEEDEKDGRECTFRLNPWQGAVLLTAECLGTGLLALPGNISTLGSAFGFFFLLLQLPVSLYAGTIFHWTATLVEQQQDWENRLYQEALQQGKIRKPVATKEFSTSTTVQPPHDDANSTDYREINQNTVSSILSLLSQPQKPPPSHDEENDDDDEWIDIRPVTAVSGEKLHHDTATHDYIGFTQALFDNKKATRIVRIIYYLNIFLVLGNYVLVMSHSLQAVFVQLCLPAAGLYACLCMWGVSQLRTMARLGRTASGLSLLALLVVVVQCLWAIHNRAPMHGMDVTNTTTVDFASTSNRTSTNTATWLRKFSALGSIGFAVGSQKLFLNIRHELAHRPRAPQSLALSLSIFGTFYVVLVLMAGPDPPAFLLDAIPVGTLSKRIAGLLLYAHIVVSYAINSQALCSSLDRAYWRLVERSPTIRWMIWTTLLSVLAYTVANAIPFFSDLVSFIGAITSVPLTLLFPALFWRKINGWALFGLTLDWSCALTYFSLVFMITATAGSVYSIQKDWSHHGAPFSCQLLS